MKIFDARSTIFLTDKMAKLQKYGILKYTSPKVLFWLRDLWQKAGDYGLSNIKSQMSNLEMTK
jgi:hypothetical protein